MKFIKIVDGMDEPETEVLCGDDRGEYIIGYLGRDEYGWLCENDYEIMREPTNYIELDKIKREE